MHKKVPAQKAGAYPSQTGCGKHATRLCVEGRNNFKLHRPRPVKPVKQPDAVKSVEIAQARRELGEHLHRALNASRPAWLDRRAFRLAVWRVNQTNGCEFEFQACS